MSLRSLRNHNKKIAQQQNNVSDDTNPPLDTENTSLPAETPSVITNGAQSPTSIQNTDNSNKTVECSTEYAIHRTQILDPLSAIIYLAILSYKPVNTKISISNNCIHVQEVGIFQAFVRYLFRDNKYYLNLLYNPIEFACEHFLDKEQLKQLPKITLLFERALIGINQLCETYTDDNVIRLCLNYYSSLIQNYLGKTYDENLFKLDTMTPHYKKDLVQKLNARWSAEKLKIIVEMNEFLAKGADASADNASTNGTNYDNVMCMQMFMRDIDAETTRIVYTV